MINPFNFNLRSRLERLYGGRCFVGLRIPDPDAGARQHVDVVLVTKRSARDHPRSLPLPRSLRSASCLFPFR